MKITLNFVGLLKECIGAETATFTFSRNASFGDLLDEIGSRYQEKLPNRLWDNKNRQFTPGVLCVGEGRDLERKNTLLKDEEVISIVVHTAGG